MLVTSVTYEYNNAQLQQYVHHKASISSCILHKHNFTPTSPATCYNIVSALISGSLCPSLYASHSFRIGAATTVAAVGITLLLIKTLERWNSNSYMPYIRCPQSVIFTIPEHLTASVSADTWNSDL